MTKEELYTLLKDGLGAIPYSGAWDRFDPPVWLIFFDDHGWREDLIKLRTEGSDYLIGLTSVPGVVSVGCMCMKSNKVELAITDLVGVMQSTLRHRCLPWGG